MIASKILKESAVSKKEIEASHAGDSAAASDEKLSSPLTRLSVNQMTTYRWSLLEDVTGYHENGITAIGVWRPKLSEFGEERGIELLRDSGLKVSSISWVGGFTGSHGCSFQEALDDARDAVEIAGRLQADNLLVISGSRAGHTGNHARRLFLDAVKELADLAAERNVVLAIEPMHSMFACEWTFLNTLDDTLEMIERCHHPFVQMAFDVYHLWQEPKLIERIPEITPSIATVQLSDWREPPRSDNDRHLPGTGIIPLSEIVSTFIESGYQGVFDFEIWSEHLWNSDYHTLLNRCREQFLSIYPSQR